jgi:hypothetical protein
MSCAMWATERPRARRAGRTPAGTVTVEFSLAVLVFCIALFGVLELARALYLSGAVVEATRRAAYAAAVTDFSNAEAMSALRQSAVLRTSPGPMPMGAPVTDAYLRIDYLSLARAGDGTLSLTPIAEGNRPACPARARVLCAADPNGPSCIRFVRVRLCAPDDADCRPVPYRPMLPFIDLGFHLPTATTIARAESLGFQPGSPLCP